MTQELDLSIPTNQLATMIQHEVNNILSIRSQQELRNDTHAAILKSPPNPLPTPPPPHLDSDPMSSTPPHTNDTTPPVIPVESSHEQQQARKSQPQSTAVSGSESVPVSRIPSMADAETKCSSQVGGASSASLATQPIAPSTRSPVDILTLEAVQCSRSRSNSDAQPAAASPTIIKDQSSSHSSTSPSSSVATAAAPIPIPPPAPSSSSVSVAPPLSIERSTSSRLVDKPSPHGTPSDTIQLMLSPDRKSSTTESTTAGSLRSSNSGASLSSLDTLLSNNVLARAPPDLFDLSLEVPPPSEDAAEGQAQDYTELLKATEKVEKDSRAARRVFEQRINKHKEIQASLYKVDMCYHIISHKDGP
jgi:hypothetical protein